MNATAVPKLFTHLYVIILAAHKTNSLICLSIHTNLLPIYGYLVRFKIESAIIHIYFIKMARFFVFSPLYTTTFPSVDEFNLHIAQYGATLVAFDVDEMIYFMVGFNEVNDTYRLWARMKDDDERIKIGVEGKWWLYS